MYLANFLTIMKTAAERYSGLLDQSTRDAWSAVECLPQDAQKLLARLFARKGPWFRVDSLKYEDIGDVREAVQRLADSSIMTGFDPIVVCAEEVWDVLSVDDLKVELRNRGKGVTAKCPRRKDFLHAIELSDGGLNRLPRLIRGPLGVVAFTASSVASLRRLHRLFFLFDVDDQNNMLLKDLLGIHYASYKVCPVSASTLPFQNAEQLAQYEECVDLAVSVLSALEDGDVANCETLVSECETRLRMLSSAPAPPPSPDTVCFDRLTPSYVLANVITAVVSILEKEGKYTRAIGSLRCALSQLAESRRRGYWWSRLAMDLEHVGKQDEALEECEKALAIRWSEREIAWASSGDWLVCGNLHDVGEVCHPDFSGQKAQRRRRRPARVMSSGRSSLES